MERLFEFGLLTQDLDFSLSDLRNADAMLTRLAQKHQLLIKRRGNHLVGVLFEPESLRAIAAKVAQLEERVKQLQGELDTRDDEALEALCAERLAKPERYGRGSKEASDGVRRLLRGEGLLSKRA